MPLPRGAVKEAMVLGHDPLENILGHHMIRSEDGVQVTLPTAMANTRPYDEQIKFDPTMHPPSETPFPSSDFAVLGKINAWPANLHALQ